MTPCVEMRRLQAERDDVAVVTRIIDDEPTLRQHPSRHAFQVWLTRKLRDDPHICGNRDHLKAYVRKWLEKHACPDATFPGAFGSTFPDPEADGLARFIRYRNEQLLGWDCHRYVSGTAAPSAVERSVDRAA